MYQPLEQFNINILHEFFIWGNSVSPIFFLTNYCITATVLLLFFLFFFVLPLRIDTFVPTNSIIVVQTIYSFLLKLFSSHTSSLHSAYYYPLICTVFLTILLGNLLGILPYGFTVTSHLGTTLALSLIMFVGIVVIAIYYNRLDYFKFFVPTSMKGPLKYYLIVIEVFSYLIRPFSLAIRLFANMLAGHTLLKILNTFTVYMVSKNWLLIFMLPLIPVFLIFMLEFAIAFIQSYVFTILLVIYINDIYNITH